MHTNSIAQPVLRCTSLASQAIKRRQQDRDEIRQLTQEYLARGGKITEVHGPYDFVEANRSLETPATKKSRRKIITPDDIGTIYLTSQQAAKYLGKRHPIFCKEVRDNRYGLRIVGQLGSANLFKRTDLDTVLKKIAKEKR